MDISQWNQQINLKNIKSKLIWKESSYESSSLDIIMIFSQNILRQIFKYLNKRDLIECSLVAVHWNCFILDNGYR